MAQGEMRGYKLHARSTDTFGRVACNTRNHHFIVDGPVQNGCPGEAITPAELFLSGIAACGVELMQVIAKDQQLPLRAIEVDIEGGLDRSNPVRRDVTVFNRVRLDFRLKGVTQAQATQLVEQFKGR